MALYLITLFVILTPGILITLPANTSKVLAAVIHGSIFVIIYQLTRRFVPQNTYNYEPFFDASMAAKCTDGDYCPTGWSCTNIKGECVQAPTKIPSSVPCNTGFCPTNSTCTNNGICVRSSTPGTDTNWIPTNPTVNQALSDGSVDIGGGGGTETPPPADQSPPPQLNSRDLALGITTATTALNAALGSRTSAKSRAIQKATSAATLVATARNNAAIAKTKAINAKQLKDDQVSAQQEVDTATALVRASSTTATRSQLTTATLHLQQKRSAANTAVASADTAAKSAIRTRELAQTGLSESAAAADLYATAAARVVTADTALAAAKAARGDTLTTSAQSTSAARATEAGLATAAALTAHTKADEFAAEPVKNKWIDYAT